MTLSLAAALLLATLPPSTASAPAAADDSTAQGQSAPHATARVHPGADALGRSGALRALFLPAGAKLDAALEFSPDVFDGGARWRSSTGLVEALSRELAAPSKPGVWLLEVDSTTKPMKLSVITGVPLSERRGGYLNGYHVGVWPAERAKRDGRYAAPSSLIEVTRENQDLYVSEHFQLRQFLTKDQKDVWPKYLALDLRLIDKLELVIQELNSMGHRTTRLHVMSGFRTPQYNGPGGKGRAKFSRHTYGDAADVWVDEDGDGSMDDLDGDGRVSVKDCDVILSAIERVEAKHPELSGGAGVYKANRSHGPFVHIDARGTEARWANK